MVNQQKAGYQEIEHAADWELEAWAPGFSELLIQVAKGMYHLAGLKLTGYPIIEKQISLEKPDAEQLLVAFLNELVFYLDEDHLGFEQFILEISGKVLSAKLIGSPVQSIQKEIKAVTYHNLSVKINQHGYRVRIVMDI